MVTDLPMFLVQCVVGVGTIALALVSTFAACKASKAANVANDLSEKAARKDAEEYERGIEKDKRDQASKIWVSMLFVTDKAFSDGPTYGVLLIRNGSNRPISDVKIASQGWSKDNKSWFSKDKCEIAAVYPGDTIVTSKNSKTDWDIPKYYFPYFDMACNNMVGPSDGQTYVKSVKFKDADGQEWELENGRYLKPA